MFMFCAVCQYSELFDFSVLICVCGGDFFNLFQASEIKFIFFHLYLEKPFWFVFACRLEFSFLCLKELGSPPYFSVAFFFLIESNSERNTKIAVPPILFEIRYN